MPEPPDDTQPIRDSRTGDSLGATRAEYDAGRPAEAVGALCHAPFVGLDFSPSGHVTVCNHFNQAMARVDEDFSILAFWRGERMRALRAAMRRYTIDPSVCRHCAHQIAARTFGETFARVQFDATPASEEDPPYPRRLIFRLNSTCNQACVMCSGGTSSRIRKEFEKLPLEPSRYGERFFAELEEILPHVEHIEFYGGEPFLVREHVRVFELLEKTASPATLYVNTNATALNARARGFLERLNFTCVAVSMDAVSREVHEAVRYGLKQERFLANLEWLRRLASKRGFYLMLNVTEHRKNWFELPEVFRFAEDRGLPIHINTCVHPGNVTLYTLQTGQLRYLLGFFERQLECIEEAYERFRNAPAYAHLLGLVRAELGRREKGVATASTQESAFSDGLLAAPIPGQAPFADEAVLEDELRRMAATMEPAEAARIREAVDARRAGTCAGAAAPAAAQV